MLHAGESGADFLGKFGCTPLYYLDKVQAAFQKGEPAKCSKRYTHDTGTAPRGEVYSFVVDVEVTAALEAA